MADAPVTPVAVIGMACRLPGGIDSPAKLWDALLRGDDLVTEIPLERWDADEFYDPEPGVAGRSVSKWGGFLDDVGGFDADFFGIGEREAIVIDPQQRLLLETSWEALEHAGVDPATVADSLTGVFVGMTYANYQLLAADARVLDGPYGFTGSNFSLASGRIAYALGARGPAYTVDSACSSGLLAIHNACRSLGDGESDLALAGGVHIVLEPRKMASGSAQGMLSPTGRCHAFDVAADGFVSGEGCAVVLLKRLPDAVRDGDRVLAVIRGTAANQDGRTVNIATPSRDAQVAVYRAALAAAATDPTTIGMIEAHGTGTPVGDPIEYAGLADVYGTTGPCALGSAKTNFGHTQSASGVVSLIKAVLALQEAVIPPSLHFERLPDQMAAITQICSCRARTCRGLPSTDIPGAPRCRHTACRAPTYTWCSSRRPPRRSPRRSSRDVTSRALAAPGPSCSPCPRRRPTRCARARAGWPTGSPRRICVAVDWPISDIRWPAAAATATFARPYWQPRQTNSSRRYAK